MSVRYTPFTYNQYISNLPGFFLNSRGCKYKRDMYSHEVNSLKNLANMQRMIPLKYLPVFARVQIQAPHVFAQKLVPPEYFPACIGFVPGGTPFTYLLEKSSDSVQKLPQICTQLSHACVITSLKAKKRWGR